MNTVIGIVIWVSTIGAIATLIIRARLKQNFSRLGLWITILLAIAVMLTTLISGLVFIRPQERGVVLSFISAKGYREQALEPGLHWIVPYAEQLLLYPISRQTYTMTTISDANNAQISANRMTEDGDSIQ